MNNEAKIVEEAWLEYQRKLLSYIQSHVNSHEKAEDLLNDVFVKLTSTVAANAAPDNISAWLYRVTKNKIIDYYRTRKSLEQLPDEFSIEAEKASIIKQLSKCMLPMIKALPETYQQPLLLSEIEGLKYKDVATELGLSVSAVKSRILRGREKLHNDITKCCTVYSNDAGETTDYKQNYSNSCSGY